MFRSPLPGTSGANVLSVLRNEPALRCPPIVVLSGSAHQPDIDGAYALGAHGCLVKVFDAEQFRLSIATLFASLDQPADR